MALLASKVSPLGRWNSLVDVVRMLIMSGCRKGEALTATWSQIDLEAAWTKPASLDEAKTHAPDSLVRRGGRAPAPGPRRQSPHFIHIPCAKYIYPAPKTDLTRPDIKAADLDGLRLHDLRHSHATMLAAAGVSLPTIGALLGHVKS
jgi:integrase